MRNRRVRLLVRTTISFVLVVCCARTTAFGASAKLLFNLTAPQPEPDAHFGETLATANGDIVVGEPQRWLGDIGLAGQAYLFDGESGDLELTFSNPEPVRDDIFGYSLAGGDSWVFIGARNRGRVYAYDKSSGNIVHRIENPTTHRGSFGSAIAYVDGALFVSTPSYSVPFETPLSVGQGYLFDPASGSLQRTFSNPEPDRNDALGVSLAIVGERVFMGSITDNSLAGRVWVFNRRTGAVEFKLENPNPETQNLDWFGSPVVANDRYIVIGAQEDGTSGVPGSGTVYVFDFNSGELLHTLFSPQNQEDGEFGRALALTPSGQILIGAWATDVNGYERSGRAYLFDGHTGNLLLEILNPEPAVAASFGWSVAATENRLIVGARGTSVDGIPGAGSVYVYAIVAEPHSGTLVKLSIAAGLIVYVVRQRGPRLCH